MDIVHEGAEESYHLSAFRARLRTHVRQEHDRVSRGQGQGAIDLARVADAETATKAGNFRRVIELLGAWPTPLSIFLRTPEGQMLGAEARSTVTRGLSLLGTAHVELSEFDRAEEILRLAVQYAGEGQDSADVYLRLGVALLADSRPGEAIGLLRRAARWAGSRARFGPPSGEPSWLGSATWRLWRPPLLQLKPGFRSNPLWSIRREAAEHLGSSYRAWAHFVGEEMESEDGHHWAAAPALGARAAVLIEGCRCWGLPVLMGLPCRSGRFEAELRGLTAVFRRCYIRGRPKTAAARDARGQDPLRAGPCYGSPQ